MNQIISSQAIPLPEPRTPITIRAATLDDIPFMDALQKKHSTELGFFSRAMFEGYVTKYRTLIAEVGGRQSSAAGCVAGDDRVAGAASRSDALHRTPIGYIVSTDRYLKRDELGAVFQLCVDPSYRRGFVAAALLKAVFEQSAYGCRLYCCWCAQDLAANRFWESMGFVPIAYRAGGRGRGSRARGSRLDAAVDVHPTSNHKPPTSHRVHIYWQKRIRAGDTTTPYWFPAKTEGGAIREDRIILPIPPGMKWDDELPVLLTEQPEPGESDPTGLLRDPSLEKAKPSPSSKRRDHSEQSAKPIGAAFAPIEKLAEKPVQTIRTGRLAFFGTAPAATPVPSNASISSGPEKSDKPKREKKRAKAKANPELIAKARELRDKWMEQVNANPEAFLPAGRYEVSREIGARTSTQRIAA